MAVEDSEEHRALLAEIGEATLNAGSIDLGLIFLLGAILAPVPSAGHAAELASVFIHAARSFDQRLEIIRGAFHARFDADRMVPKQNNRRRSIEFIEKLMDRALHLVGTHIWIRNFAAHGTISLVDDEPRLVAGLYDFQSQAKMSKRSHAKGMNAQQVRDSSKLLGEANSHLMALAVVIATFMQWYHIIPHKFLAEVNQLAAALNMPKLHLQDPREGPPLRQRRAKKERR